MTELKECHRKNFCKDCDDEECSFAGSIEADCPKYHCDNILHDCERCVFIKRFYREVRWTD